jgi:transketolase
MLSNERLKELMEKAYRIRRHVLEMTTSAGTGHPGGSLSCADILVALYFHTIQHDPKNPNRPDRDRFILRKGHACPALYATLAEAGYFPIEELKNLRKLGSRLQGHPDLNRRLPGIENSSGSLGNGLAIANGIALSGKLDKKDYRVYVLLGDGECQEGLIWEAAMFAAHYKIDNLTAVVDRNSLQIDGPTEKVMSLEPLADKWRAFGWNVMEIDGHDINSIVNAFEETKCVNGRPSIIIAYLIKGRGVSFMEWMREYHGKTLSPEDLNRALADLESWYESELSKSEVGKC